SRYEGSDLQRAKEATLLWTSWVQRWKGLLMDERALAIKERRDAVEAVDTKPVVKAIMLSYAECDEKQILPAFFFALHVFRQYNNWGHLLSESDCLMSAVGPILKEFMAVQHEIKFTSANACTRVGKARKMHLQQSGQSRQPDVIGLTASNEEVFYGELKGPTPKAATVNTDVLRLAVFSKDSLDQAHKVLVQGPPLLTFQTVGRDVTFFLAAKISNTIVHTRLSSVRLPAFLSDVDVDLDVFFHLFQVQSLVHVTRLIMPSLSAQDALEQARVNIQAAREAQDSDRVIKHYQTAKNGLTKVDVAKADVRALTEMITRFEDLAVILEKWDVDRAVKCRKRADILRQELDKRNRTIKAAIDLSLLGPGLLHVAISSLSGGTTSTVGLLRSSIAATITPSASASDDSSDERAVHTASSATRQQAPSSQRAIISVLAATGSVTNLLPFSKKAAPALLNWRLSAPDKQLENTRQLAYSLALLQETTDETLLDSATLEWRLNIKEHPGERHRLETLANDIVAAFFEDPLKHADAVAEVIHVAPALDKTSFRSLLNILVETVSESKLLHLHAMEGLARAIQGATPGSIESDDLLVILQVLYKRLNVIHTLSSTYLCRLLFATSQVLDAMVIAQVGDVARVILHEPLTVRFHELESTQDRYVAFQAKYATQALLHVSDDDNIWRAGFRWGWLVMRGAAGFAKMPDLKDINDVFEGVEKLYGASKGAVRILNNTRVAIKTGEKPTFNTKEGLKFKWSWYPTLRYAEEYIQTGDLIRFQELVATAPCRDQLTFQTGICQLLGRFAVDTQWDLEARQGTVAFLEMLCRDDRIWTRQEGVHQVVFDLISIIGFNAAKTLQVELQRQNSALVPLSNPRLHPWSDIVSLSSTEDATPTSTLLKAVQSKKQQEAHLAAIYRHVRPSHPSLEKIQSALKTHYLPNLKILRITGEGLDIDTCFVNLAIVEALAQREKEKQELKEQAAVFHRIPSSEAVRGSNIESSIRLEQLFDKRKLRDGKEGIPQRILVQGRAGIGKTTLCKKIVHLHQIGLWAARFEAVLWLPLRRLRGSTCRTLESLLREKVFTSQLDREHEELARTLAIRADEGKVLFILDGLDEIATDTQNEDSSIKVLLRDLLDQKQVIITSRPSGLDASLLRSIDLELETIGFSQQDVKEFIGRVLKPGPARTVQDFIQRTPLIQGLVNIPVQLDVICFCWESLPQDDSQITIIMLYQLMSRKLWCKDALRLEKCRGGKVLTENQINRLTPKGIDRLMSTELQHLGHLAFKGLKNNHQIEFDEAALLDSFEDLADTDSTDDNSPYSSEVLDMVKETSFLHSADADLDISKKPSQQTWSFLHLTFQEYFAATWIVSKMAAAGDDGESHALVSQPDR
ncbi:hypothetical protein BGZ47_002088, partial [Haplosporangium gracile]